MRKVEVNIKIQSTPNLILSAFTDQKMLYDWWGVERNLIELKPGGVYSLAWNISKVGFGFISSGIIDEYIPKEKLIIKDFVYFNPEKLILGPMSLSIIVKPDGKFTNLYICQDGYQFGEDWDWYYEAVVDAWPKALEILKSYIETL